MKIMMISKAMTFCDVTQPVIRNLHDFFMISDLRFLHAEILMLKSAHVNLRNRICRFARFHIAPQAVSDRYTITKNGSFTSSPLNEAVSLTF
jgi:hypothetical protein